jgi:DnaJ-class molecular chaperone
MTTDDTQICIDCNGRGEILPAFHQMGLTITCDRCQGTGQMPRHQLPWIEAGRRLRQERINRRETLRDCATRLNLDVMAVSDAERGKIDPATLTGDSHP